MELTLAYIVVLNRKRSVEAHRILLNDYEHIVHTVMRGKLDRTVCAFVPAKVKRFLDYITVHRTKAKVPFDNPYVFGLPGKLSGMRHKTLETCDVMRKYTTKADLDNPCSIRTTLLRHHFATSVSALQLQDAQQDTVMEFMGHNEKIYKSFYREHIVTKDLMVNKILNCGIANVPCTSTSKLLLDRMNLDS